MHVCVCVCFLVCRGVSVCACGTFVYCVYFWVQDKKLLDADIHKLWTMLRLSDFVAVRKRFDIVSSGSVSQLQNTVGR